jgi:hypothetical protein
MLIAFKLHGVLTFPFSSSVCPFHSVLFALHLRSLSVQDLRFRDGISFVEVFDSDHP